MSFFDKLKSGVAEAGNKAKIAVEVNRLKMQNSSKQKEIEQEYQHIGKMVFDALERESMCSPEQLQPMVNRIVQLQDEIQLNLQQINAIADEKKCTCGHTVPVAARFCPECGHQFIEIEKQESDV
ncbi:zinc ribbon domain-containing protein [Paenibacillus dokdonensis]|uniref:Zinc ribbon domain-containing protein n=1 Tax=Paenibacillus dokdonensis TaxID=2567944 RepID=A0ABU6GRJ1_9BACL|nr:zinc ribbon domain-containing protein [Paenibacillus dokdonensis]MEC0240772.1 zinc ribbon domain-containing protein [Paenibacillus dokdonensis]